jgi:inner membrane protein
MRFPVMAKLGALAAVGLVLCGVLARIEGLVDERGQRRDEAVRGVEQAHAGSQAGLGPLLVRRCTERWDEALPTAAREPVVSERSFVLRQLPAQLAIDAATTAQPLTRGLFKVNTWSGHLVLEARFDDRAALRPVAGHPGGRVQCDAPQAMLALSDVRGIRVAQAQLDGAALQVRPGTPSDKYPHGLQATLPAGVVDGDAGHAPATVRVVLDLVGTGGLAWVPAADQLTWTLRSDWPHPSFGGQFVPAQREVRADGFRATWTLSALATTAAADVGRDASLCVPAAVGLDAEPAPKGDNCLDTMAVTFIDPVNPYVLSDRATKYALLFIVLTFVAVGLVEVLSGRRVHPVQYALVGLALSLFFLLLLSLSEHLAFGLAYAVAAAACALLLAFYASAMLGRGAAGAGFGAGIAALYGLLYALLQMEQNALVIGSVMLFAALAAVMALTRRVDWYALFARLRAEPAAAQAAR